MTSTWTTPASIATPAAGWLPTPSAAPGPKGQGRAPQRHKVIPVGSYSPIGSGAARGGSSSHFFMPSFLVGEVGKGREIDGSVLSKIQDMLRQ